jgi:putative ATP-binding cassette transporter
MLDESSAPASGKPPRRPHRVVESRTRSGRSQRFLRLSLGFWSGTTRARAWLLTSIVLFFLFANLGAALAVNRWNKFFFDALEQKDTQAVIFGLGLILALALLSAAFSVGLLHARVRLQLRWRQWLTRTLVSRGLANRLFLPTDHRAHRG